MTKKHFKVLAEMLKEIHETLADSEDNVPWADVQCRIENFCATQNPNFDHDRFADACYGRPYRK